MVNLRSKEGLSNALRVKQNSCGKIDLARSVLQMFGSAVFEGSRMGPQFLSSVVLRGGGGTCVRVAAAH